MIHYHELNHPALRPLSAEQIGKLPHRGEISPGIQQFGREFNFVSCIEYGGGKY